MLLKRCINLFFILIRPQVVFEMKKKEIEKARNQLEEGRDGVNFSVSFNP